MYRVTGWAQLHRAWRQWGERAFVVAGSLWLAYQLLATLDAHEYVCEFLGRFEHLDLDELLLLAVLAVPLMGVLLWRQSRRLQREINRRAASDVLANVMAKLADQQRIPPR